jgi:hypothetical protein
MAYSWSEGLTNVPRAKMVEHRNKTDVYSLGSHSIDIAQTFMENRFNF